MAATPPLRSRVNRWLARNGFRIRLVLIAVIPTATLAGVAIGLGWDAFQRVRLTQSDQGTAQLSAALVAAVNAVGQEHREFVRFVELPQSARATSVAPQAAANSAMNDALEAARDTDGADSDLVAQLELISRQLKLIQSRVKASPTYSGAPMQAHLGNLQSLAAFVARREPRSQSVQVLEQHAKLAASLRLWSSFGQEDAALSAFLRDPNSKTLKVAAGGRVVDFQTQLETLNDPSLAAPDLGIDGALASMYTAVEDQVVGLEIRGVNPTQGDWARIQGARADAIERHTNAVSASYADAIADYHSGEVARFWWIITLLLVVQLLTWGLVVALARSVIDRLQALSRGATNLIEGQLEMPVTRVRNDEIDQVQLVFRQVASRLDQFRSEAERLSVALLAGNTSARADEHSFQGEWNRLIAGLNLVMDRHEQTVDELRIEAEQRRVIGSIADLALHREGVTQLIELSGDAILTAAQADAIEFWEVTDSTTLTLRWSMNTSNQPVERPVSVTVPDLFDFDPAISMSFPGCRYPIARPVTAQRGPVAIIIVWHEVEHLDSTAFVTDVAQLLSTIARRDESDQRARYNSLHDDATGLPNARYLEMLLFSALEQSGEDQVAVVVIRANFVDNERVVNQGMTNQLMRLMSARLRSAASPTWIVGTQRAHELSVVIPNTSTPDDDALRCVAALEEIGAHQSVSIRIRGGLATTSDVERPSVAGLLMAAAQASRAAESQGVHLVRFDSDLGHQMSHRQQVRARLESDVARGGASFSVVLQPIVSIPDEEVSGFEALARWSPEGLGPQRPDIFIPIAEEMGLVTELGAVLARQAMSEVVALGRPELTLAINVSAIDLMQPNHALRLISIAREEDFPLDKLAVELTETAMVTGTGDLIREQMEVLREHGCHLSIDDFGTGHASFAYLTDFPVEKVKIDRSFITEIHRRPEAAKVVRTIITLAHELGLSVVAEGVESREELDTVVDMKCDFVQGYVFSPPLAPLDVPQRLRELAGIVPRALPSVRL